MNPSDHMISDLQAKAPITSISERPQAWTRLTVLESTDQSTGPVV